MVAASVTIKCIHCNTNITITPPYSVAWRSTAWIGCSNERCKRPNKILFLNGINTSTVNITKSLIAPSMLTSSNPKDRELGEMLKQVEDSNIHDQHTGSAIILRVCLEQLTWVRVLSRKAKDVQVNPTVLTDIKKKLNDKSTVPKVVGEVEDAFNFILDLGDTAAHYELRDQSRKKLATQASVDLAISKFDRLSEILLGPVT